MLHGTTVKKKKKKKRVIVVGNVALDDLEIIASSNGAMTPFAVGIGDTWLGRRDISASKKIF
jgi:hypothetical protein